ncbi:MAG: glycoside hydrolase family 3 C-terminal domain-containing protein [Anaerolineae bacterium]|nr:glycoside hydrolase family 3 C-terminal domain-containing protein [Anaerolineae bacterium]
MCTDCMEMKAISNHYSAGESAVLAALAGIDLILFSHTRTMQEAAYEGLLEAAQSGRVSLAMIDNANQRIAKLKEQYAVSDIDIGQIRNPDHLETADKAAHAGTVLLKSDDRVFPLKPETHTIALIEFASYLDSEVLEEGGQTGLTKILAEAMPQIEMVTLKVSAASATSAIEGIDDEPLQKAQKLAAESDILVLATRNAHLWDAERQMAEDFISRAKQVILLCLRNPYDASVLDAGTVLCTLGDATPSLQAAVDALMGEFTPSGKLPVTL